MVGGVLVATGCVLSLASFVAAGASTVSFASMFVLEGARPILQQREWVAVWGHASLPRSRVDIALHGQHVASAVTDASGRWLAHLPPQPPQWGVLLTASEPAGSVASTVVDFGVVVLCSGQSNMQVSLLLPHISFH